MGLRFTPIEKAERTRIAAGFMRQYPGIKIRHFDLEIICGHEPASKHPEWSGALHAIKLSRPRFHEKTERTYVVQEGQLKVFINGGRIQLYPGRSVTVSPQGVYWEESMSDTPAIVSIQNRPGLTPKDNHIMTLEELRETGYAWEEQLEVFAYSFPELKSRKNSS